MIKEGEAMTEEQEWNRSTRKSFDTISIAAGLLFYIAVLLYLLKNSLMPLAVIGFSLVLVLVNVIDIWTTR